MLNTLLGVKKGMSSSYDSRGRRVGVTVLEITPNLITQLNPHSIQLGMGVKKSVKKPQIGHLKKAGIEQKVRWLREVKKIGEDLKPGQEINLGQVFSKGDSVKVSGVSKGKGFQGGVRRHGFHGGPKTHGQSDRHRAPGSIGSGTTPGRVFKGKKMAGHMGMEGVSYKNLEVVAVDKVNNLLTIKGGVPGPVGGLVSVEKLGRIKGYTPPPEEKPSDDESVEGKEEEEAASAEGFGEPKEEVKVEEKTEVVEQEGAEDA